MYKHLTQQQRDQIAVMINRKESFRSIAQSLGRNVATIAREVRRNFGLIRYRPHQAHLRAVLSHHKAHTRPRLKTHALRLEVEKRIREGWSPELIAGRIELQKHLPTVSHEAIYQWIYKEAPHLIDSLVRSHPMRWPKGKSKTRRIPIPRRVSIQNRPRAASLRLESGHWESDLITCQGSSAIQTSVERKSRFTKLNKLPDKTALTCRLSLQAFLEPIPKSLKRSITYDNGFENMEHHLLNERLGTRSYFCRPYHSWEKGTVENTNGLVRRFLPKKTNFDTISKDQVQQVESWLNNRPRKCLNFKTPAEVFNSWCCTC